MAISRYNRSPIIRNATYAYASSNVFKRRNVGSISQFPTQVLSYPSPEQIANLTLVKRVWAVGTKYYNLANEFYGDPEYWWAIALFNLRPLETDYNTGDIVVIPTPLLRILGYYGYNGF